jgi:molecular chaperone HscB
VDINNDFFAIFNLPVAYRIDMEALRGEYLVLQQQYHPDRHVNESVAVQQQVVEFAATVNQAYGVLKSPIKRAQYLLELSGLEADNSGETTADRELLLEQIRLRERMAELSEDADPMAELTEMEQNVTSDMEALEQEFESLYSVGNFLQARQTLVKIQFYSRLLDELEELAVNLEDGLN